MSEKLLRIICFLIEHWILSMIGIPALMVACALWAISSGHGEYIAYVFIGLYALVGLGDMINNHQRDKYLRELKSPDVSERTDHE